MESQNKVILAEQLARNDRALVDSQRRIIGNVESYVLRVLPQDVIATIRAIALDELQTQEVLDNRPSQIIVDNLPVSKKGIDYAVRRVVIRFGDTQAMISAVKEIYDLLQRITRIQEPPKNAVVARREFHLMLNGVMLGRLPESMQKIMYPGVLTQDSVVRVVGPLVPYGRKLFWNPVGTSAKMQVRRVKSKKGLGVRFLAMRGASIYAPRFKPYAPRTLRRKANQSGSPAQVLAAMMQGSIPPGRTENAGQIVKRIMKGVRAYKALHFTDGWVEYGPAVGWSKLADARVPAFGVMFSKKGAMPRDKGFLL